MTPTYSPESGLVVGTTVKEWLQEKIDKGYFDKATSCVVAASEDGYFTIADRGDFMERVALCQLAGEFVRKGAIQ